MAAVRTVAARLLLPRRRWMAGDQAAPPRSGPPWLDPDGERLARAGGGAGEAVGSGGGEDLTAAAEVEEERRRGEHGGGVVAAAAGGSGDWRGDWRPTGQIRRPLPAREAISPVCQREEELRLGMR
uniref:Uncharacterized protein n=1 Tax=Oryza barthii TaxID=65489 RepID=A0A0D3F392_9ORYZ